MSDKYESKIQSKTKIFEKQLQIQDESLFIFNLFTSNFINMSMMNGY